MDRKEICEQMGLKYYCILARMYSKKMTFEEAINYKSVQQIFKPIREKAIRLGLSVKTVRERFHKGLRGDKLFETVGKRGGYRDKKKYTYVYKGKPFCKMFPAGTREYSKFIFCIKKGMTEEEAYKMAVKQ